MREGTRPNRKSERLRVSRGESSGPDSIETASLGAEVLQVFVAEGGHDNRRPGRPARAVVPEPDLNRRSPVEERTDTMTRLKYNRFKGDGSQDADDWLCEFESTALANQENEAAHQRIFQGLLKGEALRWYQDIPDPVRNNWEQLRNSFLQAFREVGGESRALGRLSKLTMRSSESVRKYGQRVKALIQKLTTEIAPSLQVEWYVAGLPAAMGFLIRQAKPRTLKEAMDAATDYENSTQSLRKSMRRSKLKEKEKGKKDDRKSKHRRKDSDSETSTDSSDSEDSGSSSSSSEVDRSPSPQRRSGKTKSLRGKAIVKVKTEDADSRKMMKSIQQSLEAIKVNLAENRKPRRIVPTSRTNVWCGRCGEQGHYPSECQRPPQKQVHYVYPEEEVYYAMAEEEEEEVFQVQPTYGRGKGVAIPIRPNMLNRNFLPGTSQGLVMQQPMRAPGYPDRPPVICYNCGDPGHYSSSCPQKGLGQGAMRPLPCQNCAGYGHSDENCHQPKQPRPVYKQVQIIPREQSALNYGHSAGTENPEK
jgi:hypothetical protein